MLLKRRRTIEKLKANNCCWKERSFVKRWLGNVHMHAQLYLLLEFCSMKMMLTNYYHKIIFHVLSKDYYRSLFCSIESAGSLTSF